VNFGGAVGAVPSYGVSYCDSGTIPPIRTVGPLRHSAYCCPSKLPLGTVATGLAGNAFTLNVAGGAMPGYGRQ
jgi:hypothetical protein